MRVQVHPAGDDATMSGPGVALTTPALPNPSEGIEMAQRTCSIDECERGGKLRRGWCEMHYRRWRMHGDPAHPALGRWANHVKPTECAVNGCEKDPHARGWCIGHYARWRTTGETGGPLLPYTRPAPERFWEKVDKAGQDECWLWTANKTAPNGHGRFLGPGGQVMAHRFAYELLVGPIPEGLVIDHLCRVRLCVNPAHLEPVTAEENIRRGWRDRMAERCA